MTSKHPVHDATYWSKPGKAYQSAMDDFFGPSDEDHADTGTAHTGPVDGPLGEGLERALARHRALSPEQFPARDEAF